MGAAFILADGTPLALAAGQRVGLTKQANDLLKPASVQADFSTTLTLADSPQVRAALGQPQQGLSLTDTPYRQLPGTLDVGGREVLPGAVAFIEQHEAGKGFEAQVLGGNKSFYAAIEGRSLRDLTFAESTAHDWSLEAAAAGAEHTAWQQAYVYDLYDKGKGGPTDGSAVPLYADSILPSVYARAVWEQIIREAGFQWSGPMPELFDRLLLPTATHPGYGEAFRSARKLLAGLSGQRQEEGRAYEGRPDFVRTVPFDFTDARRGYQAPTKALMWNPLTHSWRALEPAYVTVQASTNVRLRSPYGQAKAQLFVMVNGQKIAGGEPAGSKKNSAELATYTPSVQLTRYLLQPGDVLTVRMEIRGDRAGLSALFTDAKWGFEVFTGAVYATDGVTAPADVFSVEVLADFAPGGRVQLQDLLPAMSQTDFVKGVVGLLGLTQQTDPYTRRLTFTPTGPALAAGLAGAEDWQPRVDGVAPAARLFHLPGTAQRNWFRWKEDKTNPDGAQGLGDGYLPCPDATLEPEQNVLTLPWAATASSDSGLPLLPVYKRRTGSVSVTPEYDTQSPAPRLLVQTTATRTVRFTGEGARTTRAVSPRISTFAGLDFAADLLPTWYGHLRAVYARPLLLRPSVRLSIADVTDFDQLRPVWLEQEGAHFYCNKLDFWEEGDASTPVELLRLTF